MDYKLTVSLLTTFIIAFILSCGDSGPTGSGPGPDTSQFTVTLEVPLVLGVSSLAIVDTIHTSQIIVIDTATNDTIVYDTTRDTILARFIVYWDTVPRATHYFVYVLDGAGNFVRFYTIPDTLPVGTPVMSKLISGLKPNDLYLFNIAAGKDTTIIEAEDGDGILDTTLLQFVSKKTDYFYVPLYLPLSPENINVNVTDQTALISWTPSTGIGILGYTVYLYDDIGTVKDSQEVDSLTTSLNFTSLGKDRAYKVNIMTRATIGNSVICSTYAYDVSTLQDTGFKLPYVYVSAYEKPDEGNAGSIILGLGYMVGVKGGIFAMGNIWEDTTREDNGKPVHEVIVSSFYLGKYEVDNSLYSQFLNSYGVSSIQYSVEVDTAGTPIANIFVYSGDTLLKQDSLLFIYLDTSAIPDSFAVDSGKGHYPVSGIHWEGAVLFCNWLSGEDNLTPCYNPTTWVFNPSADGYRLATEAEFEYAHSAAFLGKKQRYPWGYNHDPNKYASTTTGLDTVGSYKSYFGFYNLSGNVMEWCHDLSDLVLGQDTSFYYAECLNAGVVYDPLGPASGSYHALRGGSYLVSGDRNTSAYRHTFFNYPGYGFRVARNAK